MAVTVDPITLDLHFQRLEFATGFDVRAVIEERDRLKAALTYALIHGTDELKHFDRAVAIRDAA